MSCIVAMIIMGGSILHPSCDRSGCGMAYLSIFLACSFSREPIMVVNEFIYLYL